MKFLSKAAALILSLAVLGMGTAQAKNLQPFVLASQGAGDLAAKVAESKAALTGAGFEIAGDYSPYAGTHIIAVTNDALKGNAGKSEHGGYGAAMRVALTTVDGQIQVSYTNPAYWSAMFRLSTDNAAAAAGLEKALGKVKDFGTTKELTADDLKKYHYMIMMEYFDDPSELAEYDNYADTVAAVEAALGAGAGATEKVYRIDIPGKDETVFGVALRGTDSDDCSSDNYIMGLIDKEPLRSTAHLPYELLVSGNKAYALYARFRIAASYPHLPMVASETGATFFNIMCAPDAIEEALIQAAGEEP